MPNHFPFPRSRGRFGAVLASAIVAGVAGAGAFAAGEPAAATTPSALVAKIPPRPQDARSGSRFVAFVRGMSPARREQAILDELLSGNIPRFLRNLKPIEISRCSAPCSPARSNGVLLWVMPDYLAIGSDDDFVRFPASFETATVVARELGFVLPTAALVDAIYQQAEMHLSPRPMTPGPRMTSTAFFEEHDQLIRAQLLGHPPGELVAGHKKDYVLTNRLQRAPSQEAIYGWHRGAGDPIQPLSLVHGARYADYSHGVRLVSETAYVDGVARSFYDLLEEPRLAPLVSNEGVIPDSRRLMARGPHASRASLSSAPDRPAARRTPSSRAVGRTPGAP